MENRRAIIISLICFVIALLLIMGYVNVRKYELTKTFGEEVTVVVANTYIPEYGLIREDMLETRTVFKNFRQPQTVEDYEDIIGKSTYVPIYAGEQIPLTKLINQDGKPVLDRQLERKWRAVTLPVAQRNGVGKLIRPGNRIDVLTAPNYDFEGTTLFEVKTIVQNALVLATGKNLQNAVPSRVNREVLEFLEEETAKRRRKDFSARTDRLVTGRPTDDYSSITLMVTPTAAEKLMFVSNKFGDGRIYFTLRNSSDQGVNKGLETALLDDVLGPDSDYGLSKRKPPPAPPPKPPKFYDSVGGSQVPVNR